METQQQNKNNPENNDGCLSSILSFGSLMALGYISKLISDNDRELGFEFMEWGFVIWALVNFIAFMKGKDLEETKGNYIALAVSMRFFIIIMVVLLILSPLFSSSCTDSGNTPEPTDIYFRR